MLLKKLSLVTLIIASCTSHMSFAQESFVSDPIEQPFVEPVNEELTASDLAAEAAMDDFVDLLGSMPEELQALPLNHPLVIDYIDQHQSVFNAGPDRDWGGRLKCTLYLGKFVVTTGVPVGKIFNALKSFKAIAGSWKAVRSMWKSKKWGGLKGEAYMILTKLSGIDEVIENCTGAF